MWQIQAKSRFVYSNIKELKNDKEQNHNTELTAEYVQQIYISKRESNRM